MLCPVRRPVTTLDCALLRDSNLVFEVGLGSEINFWACLWVLPGPRHIAKCWLSTRRLILFLIFCLETPRDGAGPTNFWIEPHVASLPAITFPRTPACPGTQYSPAACRVEISLNVFWHSCTKWDVVVAAWSAFRASSLRTTDTHYRRLRTARSLIFNLFLFLKGIVIKLPTYIVHSDEAKIIHV